MTVTQLASRQPAPARGEWAVIVRGCVCGGQHVVDLADVLADPGNIVLMPCGQRVGVRMRNWPGCAW